MACLPAARRRLLDDDGGGHLLVAGSTIWLEWVASPSSGFAHDIVSLHPPAASKALLQHGTCSCVCREWRDAFRRAVGVAVSALAPQWAADAQLAWTLLPRQAPWVLQLKLAVRRARLLRAWGGVQELQPLCLLLDTRREHHASPHPHVPQACVLPHRIWMLSRAALIGQLKQLFELVCVGTVASVGGGNSSSSSSTLSAGEMKAVVARLQAFAEALAARLHLQPSSGQLPMMTAANPDIQHIQVSRYRLRRLVRDTGMRVCAETIAQAAMPLCSGGDCSVAQLVSAFREQQWDIHRLGEQSCGFGDIIRSHVRHAITRTVTIAQRKDRSGTENENQSMKNDHVALLDDAVLLDILGAPIGNARRGVPFTRQLEWMRRKFRDPGFRELYDLWQITAAATHLWCSPSADCESAAHHVQQSRWTENLSLCGRSLLSSHWPEFQRTEAGKHGGKQPLGLATSVALAAAHTESTAQPGLAAVLQQPTSAAVLGRWRRVRERRCDVRLLAAYTPEHLRPRPVRALTRDVQRVWRLTAELARQGLPEIAAGPLEMGSGGLDLMNWSGHLDGPPGTAWAGGRFRFELTFDIDVYPERAPTMRFLSKVFHPNVDTSGFVCADVLQTEWSSVCSTATLILSIQSILDDPSCEHPANVEAAALLVRDRAAYLQRVRSLARASAAACLIRE
jgi:ubiquitin-protein ligase